MTRRMRRYDISYQLSHDIDWFFRINDKCFHVASNGGLIPKFLNIDNRNNFDLQCRMSLYMKRTDDILVRENPRNLDWSSFEYYAKRGFISIDRIYGNPTEQKYYVIAKPKETTPISDEIMLMLPFLKEEYKSYIEIINIDGERFNI